MKKYCPLTKEIAYARLDKRLSEEDKKAILKAKDTIEFHFTLGMWIRNNGNKNLLLPEHQDKIMDALMKRQDEQYFCKLIKNDDILANDCNLSVSSYVEQEDTREVIDIKAVNARLETLEAEGNELNQKIEAIIKELGE